VVLGAMAIFAGFLGAEPLGFAPLLHKLEPIFEESEKLVALRQGVGHGDMWTMMVPGALACFGGIGAATYVYYSKGGAPEKSFEASFPRLYALIFDKWRIDELYDATVIGMIDALADIFTMADKWIVDGVLAKLSALVVSATGAVLRLFHTGRVQVYAASMVVGLLGMGWFFAKPHARIDLDDTDLKVQGRVTAHGAPGLGYSYKWSGEGTAEDKFTPGAKYDFIVQQGASKTITLTVKNAFGQEDTTSVTIDRPGQPRPPGATRPAGAMLQPTMPDGQAPPGGGVQPGQKVRLEGDQIPNFIGNGGK
jgi:NADH-quinone oxidoreductase subunit L